MHRHQHIQMITYHNQFRVLKDPHVLFNHQGMKLFHTHSTKSPFQKFHRKCTRKSQSAPNIHRSINNILYLCKTSTWLNFEVAFFVIYPIIEFLQWFLVWTLFCDDGIVWFIGMDFLKESFNTCQTCLDILDSCKEKMHLGQVRTRWWTFKDLYI